MGHTKGNDAMENTKTRLHPLLTAAAISVTVFSAVGIASLTGLVPQSIGSQKQELAAAPLVPAPEAAPAPEIVKPAKKPVRKAAAPKPQPAVYRDYPQPAPVPQAQTPTLAQAEAPKPVVPLGQIGTVQAVREVAQPGEHTALGPIAGGVAGAVIGNQFGHGNAKKILTVLGAAGGAYAGREIEKQARAVKRWEVDVRLDNGTQQTLSSEAAPSFNPGDRVRLVEGRLQPA
jgi:outer membrane lipoprotein SlyB